VARAGTKQRGQRAGVREALAVATVEALRDAGYAGTSAREVASRAGVSQASVFYHYGTIDELLLAALDRTSESRMAAYRGAMESVATLGELFDVAGRVFTQDLDEGHLKVLSELIAAASGNATLGARIAERIDPWIVLTESTMRRVLAGTPLANVVDAHELATAIVGLYLGLELLGDLRGDRRIAESLFRSARTLASSLDGLLEPRR
jgi:AcrR family transcriptional regulator